MRSNTTLFLIVLLSFGCGPLDGEDPELPGGETRLALGASSATILSIKSDDQPLVLDRLGTVYVARTTPAAAGEPARWWLRADVTLRNTGATSLSLTGFTVDTDVTAPVDRPLESPVTVLAGRTRTVVIPGGGLTGTGAPPSQLTVSAKFAGSSLAVQRIAPVQVFESNTPSTGYRFPGKLGDLPDGAYWSVGAHADSTGQKWAYDFNVRRWSTASKKWTALTPAGEAAADPGSVNEHFLIYEVPVYAIASGHVVRCRRSIDDQAPGAEGSAGGNTIILDVGNGEYVSYHHLRNNSVPPELCPFEGVGPNDDYAPLHVAVAQGTKLGAVGNTGHSSGPHLHLQLSDSLPNGDDAIRSLPLRFNHVEVHTSSGYDPSKDDSDWAHLFGSDSAHLHPSTLVKPGACGVAPPKGQRDVRVAMSASCYQDEVESFADAGWRPALLDAYEVDGVTFFAAMFEPATGSWSARHGLTAAALQAECATRSQQGLGVRVVEAYRAGTGAERFAAVFDSTTSRRWYFGKTAAEHQTLFNQHGADGFHPTSLSVVEVDGARRYTGVYVSTPFGGWVADSTIATGDLSAVLTAQRNAGRGAASLQAYTVGGQLWYAGVFSTSVASSASAPLTAAQLAAAHALYDGLAGKPLRSLTGLEQNGEHRFVAVWGD